jgi:hypothetical protein
VSGSHTIPRAIAGGTLAVGVLDALDAIVVFGLRSGTPPARIFQGIAAGVLGPAAFRGGAATALLGLFLHFTIAFAIVSIYVGASRWMPALRRHPFLWGPVYGIAVYFLMNLVVIPLSAIGATRFTTFGVVNGLLIHAIGVGLPSAIAAASVRDRAAAGRDR